MSQDPALDEFENGLLVGGMDPSSPAFDLAVRGWKAQRCREHRGLETCVGCPHAFHCTFAHALATDARGVGSPGR